MQSYYEHILLFSLNWVCIWYRESVMCFIHKTLDLYKSHAIWFFISMTCNWCFYAVCVVNFVTCYTQTYESISLCWLRHIMYSLKLGYRSPQSIICNASSMPIHPPIPLHVTVPC
jgi:hypothetical protein